MAFHFPYGFDQNLRERRLMSYMPSKEGAESSRSPQSTEAVKRPEGTAAEAPDAARPFDTARILAGRAGADRGQDVRNQIAVGWGQYKLKISIWRGRPWFTRNGRQLTPAQVEEFVIKPDIAQANSDLAGIQRQHGGPLHEIMYQFPPNQPTINPPVAGEAGGPQGAPGGAMTTEEHPLDGSAAPATGPRAPFNADRDLPPDTDPRIKKEVAEMGEPFNRAIAEVFKSAKPEEMRLQLNVLQFAINTLGSKGITLLQKQPQILAMDDNALNELTMDGTDMAKDEWNAFRGVIKDKMNPEQRALLGRLIAALARPAAGEKVSITSTAADSPEAKRAVIELYKRLKQLEKNENGNTTQEDLTLLRGRMRMAGVDLEASDLKTGKIVMTKPGDRMWHQLLGALEAIGALYDKYVGKKKILLKKPGESGAKRLAPEAKNRVEKELDSGPEKDPAALLRKKENRIKEIGTGLDQIARQLDVKPPPSEADTKGLNQMKAKLEAEKAEVLKDLDYLKEKLKTTKPAESATTTAAPETPEERSKMNEAVRQMADALVEKGRDSSAKVLLRGTIGAIKLPDGEYQIQADMGAIRNENRVPDNVADVVGNLFTIGSGPKSVRRKVFLTLEALNRFATAAAATIKRTK